MAIASFSGIARSAPRRSSRPEPSRNVRSCSRTRTIRTLPLKPASRARQARAPHAAEKRSVRGAPTTGSPECASQIRGSAGCVPERGARAIARVLGGHQPGLRAAPRRRRPDARAGRSRAGYAESRGRRRRPSLGKLGEPPLDPRALFSVEQALASIGVSAARTWRGDGGRRALDLDPDGEHRRLRASR